MPAARISTTKAELKCSQNRPSVEQEFVDGVVPEQRRRQRVAEVRAEHPQRALDDGAVVVARFAPPLPGERQRARVVAGRQGQRQRRASTQLRFEAAGGAECSVQRVSAASGSAL